MTTTTTPIKEHTVQFSISVGLNLTCHFMEAMPLRDAFVVLPETRNFFVHAKDSEAAAEAMFAVGNRQVPDVRGTIWPSNVRSVSTGDLVVVQTMGDRRLFVVQGMGWKDVTDVRAQMFIIEEPELARTLAIRQGAAGS